MQCHSKSTTDKNAKRNETFWIDFAQVLHWKMFPVHRQVLMNFSQKVRQKLHKNYRFRFYFEQISTKFCKKSVRPKTLFFWRGKRLHLQQIAGGVAKYKNIVLWTKHIYKMALLLILAAYHSVNKVSFTILAQTLLLIRILVCPNYLVTYTCATNSLSCNGRCRNTGAKIKIHLYITLLTIRLLTFCVIMRI